MELPFPRTVVRPVAPPGALLAFRNEPTPPPDVECAFAQAFDAMTKVKQRYNATGDDWWVPFTEICAKLAERLEIPYTPTVSRRVGKR